MTEAVSVLPEKSTQLGLYEIVTPTSIDSPFGLESILSKVDTTKPLLVNIAELVELYEKNNPKLKVDNPPIYTSEGNAWEKFKVAVLSKVSKYLAQKGVGGAVYVSAPYDGVVHNGDGSNWLTAKGSAQETLEDYDSNRRIADFFLRLGGGRESHAA